MAVVAGVVAGLGVAMPLGAVAALVLREGLVNGFRVAAAAGAGVATVDLVYCAVATTTGALLARAIEDQRGAFVLVSGALVLAIGLRQLHRALTHPEGAGADVEPTSAVGAFVRFVGITAINPLTLVYFVALGSTVPTGSWVGPLVFVVAAGLASLAWQLALAGAGSLLGGALSPRVARSVGVVAALVVITLGAALAISGARSLGGGG